MSRTIHLICNAHLDPVWLWEWEEGAAAAISTFRTAADLCEESGTFVFNHNEAILYSWVEDFDPALFARIQRLVRAGRWHIMGGWYLQPDCNMTSGESFVRQILLGRQYFAEKFGARPTTAINFDPFGHTRGLVQIMARSGYDSYVFCRPGQEDCRLPDSPFVWEGYDGSHVLAVRPWGFYLSALGRAVEKVNNYLKARPQDNPGIMLWGVGDHGGGPSRADAQALDEMAAAGGEAHLLHSTPEAYFAEVRAQGKDLPVRRADINPWGSAATAQCLSRSTNTACWRTSCTQVRRCWQRLGRRGCWSTRGQNCARLSATWPQPSSTTYCLAHRSSRSKRWSCG